MHGCTDAALIIFFRLLIDYSADHLLCCMIGDLERVTDRQHKKNDQEKHALYLSRRQDPAAYFQRRGVFGTCFFDVAVDGALILRRRRAHHEEHYTPAFLQLATHVTGTLSADDKLYPSKLPSAWYDLL